MDELTSCPICGYTNAPIGALGNLLHYCCRACGMWYSDAAPVNPHISDMEA